MSSFFYCNEEIVFQWYNLSLMYARKGSNLISFAYRYPVVSMPFVEEIGISILVKIYLL